MLVWKGSHALFFRSMYMNKNSSLTPFIAHELKKLAEVGIQDVLSKRHNIPEPNCEPIHKRYSGRTLERQKLGSPF